MAMAMTTTTAAAAHRHYDHASTLESIFATMDDILSNDDDDHNDGNHLQVQIGLKLLDSMTMTPGTTSCRSSTNNNNNKINNKHSIIYYHQALLLQSSSQIITSLQSRIDFETSQLKMESRELSSKLQMVTSLENRVDALTKEREDRMERKKMIEHSIGVCREAMAAMTTTTRSSENGGGSTTTTTTSTTTTTKKKMIPKIGKEVSLHALMTNIRWDYNRSGSVSSSSSSTAIDNSITTGNNSILISENNNNHHHHHNILAGEIFHPTTQKVKKFVIDKTKCNNNEYEIAESLWKLMEG